MPGRQHLLPGTGGPVENTPRLRHGARQQPPAGAAAVGLQACSGSGPHLWCPPADCSAAPPTANSSDRGRVCCQVLVIFPSPTSELIHTLKWNTVFFFFADGITESRSLHHQPGWLMTHIMPGIIHLQVCKPRHHLKRKEWREQG